MGRQNVPERTVERLSLYRRILLALRSDTSPHVFSHQLAAMAQVSAAQVRRDLMVIGYTGSTQRGYEVAGLSSALATFLDRPGGMGAALVGVGNLGRALMAYFVGRRPNLSIQAAFDSDPDRVDRVIHGCRCHGVESLERVVTELGLRVGIIAVPAPSAQAVADRLVASGVRGLVNFAPVRLWVPAGIYVEDLDMALSLEKVAFFARQGLEEER